jgi:hypothetical protein
LFGFVKQESYILVYRISFYKRKFVIFSLLVLTGLACGLGGQQNEVSGPPGGPIPVSQEASDRLKQNFFQALQEATSTHEASWIKKTEPFTSSVSLMQILN